MELSTEQYIKTSQYLMVPCPKRWLNLDFIYRLISPAGGHPPNVLKERGGSFSFPTGNDPKTVNVIAVHGPQGDAFKIWELDKGFLWLRDSE